MIKKFYSNKSNCGFIILGALMMFTGDYLTAYYESVPVYLFGDGLSVLGWLTLFWGIDKIK